MSQTENVFCGINIAIMRCATRCTDPFSYFKPCSGVNTYGLPAYVVGRVGGTAIKILRPPIKKYDQPH